jgi:hypothetical protein
VSGRAESSHLTETELAALIYAAGQNRDIERTAYAHLAICAECTQLLGEMREADGATRKALASIDVPTPPASAATIIRLAQGHARSFKLAHGWRVAASVAALVVVAAAAAAIPASPVHRFLVRTFGAGDRIARPATTPSPAPVAVAPPGVSFVPGPDSPLEIVFTGSGMGGSVNIRIVDGDRVSLSNQDGSATYSVSSTRISINESRPGVFQLEIPRSLREVRVRAGDSVLFERAPARKSSADSVTIDLTGSKLRR